MAPDEGTTEDIVIRQLEMLIQLVYNSLRVQALTMRLLVQGTKDLSDKTKSDLLESIKNVEKAATKGVEIISPK